MHDTYVIMKDGRTFCGPIWLFKPLEGFLKLSLDQGHHKREIPDKIYFRDIRFATTKGAIVGIRDWQTGEPLIADQDELARAREEGWNGS